MKKVSYFRLAVASWTAFMQVWRVGRHGGKEATTIPIGSGGTNPTIAIRCEFVKGINYF